MARRGAGRKGYTLGITGPGFVLGDSTSMRFFSSEENLLQSTMLISLFGDINRV